MDILLEGGAPLEQTDKHGRSALMIAAEEGQVGVMELMLPKGTPALQFCFDILRVSI